MLRSRDANRRRARASFTFAVIGGLWALAHGTGLLGPLEEATFVLLGAGAVAATVVGIRWHRPSLTWPWVVIAGALVLFLAGGGARIAFATLGDVTADRSLVPDLITLPGYLLLGLGLTRLVRARQRGDGADFDVILDAIVASVAAFAIAWVFLINPVLSHEHAPRTVRLLLASYPPVSVFMVAVTARIAFSGRARRAPVRGFLLATMGFMLFGDIVYMLVDAHLVVLPLSVVDLPYALAYACVPAVVLHPSMRDLSEPAPSDESGPTRPRLAIVAVALAIPALIMATRSDVATGDRIAFAAVILALTAAAVWRMFRALRAHARAESRLSHQATHDRLTALPNREYASEHITQLLGRVGSASSHLAVLFLDLDRFKLVNDTHGHSLGDELLVAVARRLENNVREGDFVARIGGDEFVVVLDELVDVADALLMAERIRCCFQAPFWVGDAEIYASASLGLAYANGREQNVDAETLIRDADTAMYQAKAAGRDSVAVFDTSMRDDAAERLALEHDLRHALDRNELSLHFQPIVGLPGASPHGVEALLRWSSPALGNVPPDKFIPVAEDSGLIVEIGAWVIREACRHVSRWRRTLPGGADLTVSVNLSARQLRDPALVNIVASALAEHELPPRTLCLELTESLLMENPPAATEVLNTLRQLGVTLAIDDFGTGYSSLAYLKRFPVDSVKIDQTFVDGLNRDDSSEESLVAAIIAMAGALGLQTVAEGVETATQEKRLTLLGCTLAQGYFYSRPVPADQLPKTLWHLAGTLEPAEVHERATDSARTIR